MAKYNCYGCGNMFDYDEIALECMCEDKQSRGVCRDCDKTGVKINIPVYHSLSRIHVYSDECNKFWQNIYRYQPQMLTITDKGFLKIQYWEGPNGEHTYEELKRNAVNEEEQEKAVYNMKTKVFTEMSHKHLQCLCCTPKCSNRLLQRSL